MSARPGMTQIVAKLRAYGAAATTDEFNGVTYWDDDQLQTICDSNSERLTVGLKQVSRDGLIFKIDTPSGYLFETDALTVYPQGNDSESNVSFTYNLDLNELTFQTPLNTNARYEVQGLATNLFLALSVLWEQKAAQRYDYAEFRAGNNRINMEQEYEHCLERASFYRKRIVRRFNANVTGRWMR